MGYHGISWDSKPAASLDDVSAQKVGPAMDPELLDPRTGMVTTNRPVDHRRSCRRLQIDIPWNSNFLVKKQIITVAVWNKKPILIYTSLIESSLYMNTYSYTHKYTWYHLITCVIIYDHIYIYIHTYICIYIYTCTYYIILYYITLHYIIYIYIILHYIILYYILYII